MISQEAIFNRTRRLVGPDGMQRIREASVVLFGVGGVGSWCAEALVRSGVRHLTLVDGDVVNPSNVNRQLMATTRTVGRPKVEALRERLLDINPEADITPIQAVYNKESAPDFHLEQYDYIIDAIDSLKDKAALIVEASALPGTLFSSMGAACKADPTRIKVAEFWEVRGCPLGAALRKKLRKEKTLPAKPFLCVYDDEVLPNLGDSSLADNEGNSAKAVINGTLAHITGIFGFTLAGLVIRDMLDRPRG